MKAIMKALHYFRCSKNSSIEAFLQKKALNFLDRSWCSTYLFLNEKALDDGKLKIEAYFTLSHKTLLASGNISRRKKQEMTGFKSADLIPFALIGQLGKYYDEDNNLSNLSADYILDQALEIVYRSDDLIPVRNVLVECDVEKIQNLYCEYGFKWLQENQYYKRIG